MNVDNKLAISPRSLLRTVFFRDCHKIVIPFNLSLFKHLNSLNRFSKVVFLIIPTCLIKHVPVFLLQPNELYKPTPKLVK